jgi:hypothetical protein
MIRFFNFLNISEEEQNKLPQDILDGGKLIDGMQLIYEEITNERKWDVVAHTIAEMSSILLKRLNEYKLNPKAKENIDEEIKEIEEIQQTNPIIQLPPNEEPPIDEIKIVEVPPTFDDKESPKKDLFLEHIRKNLSNIEF